MNVLLHTCCGPCASACVPRLKEAGHKVTMFFSNSNLDSKVEYEKRLEAAKTLAEHDGVELIADEYDHERWLEEVARGYENCREKGERCARCFRFNLARAAEKTAVLKLDGFATSLTVSPHKVSKIIFSACEDPKFMHEDFKKKEGFKLSVKRAAELGLYRQKYCGCEFSKAAQEARKAPRIALTGGIACGKSLVAKMLGEMGVKTIDADDVVHELIPLEERKRLAKIVFKDEKARKELEARIHPLVKKRLDEELANSGNKTIAIIPLLFEKHWDGEYDIICSVVSDRELQIDRMMTTRGYTREEALARLAAQMPVEEKAAKSQHVIVNNLGVEELRRQVEEFKDRYYGR